MAALLRADNTVPYLCIYKTGRMEEKLIQALNYRYATKKFDPAKKLSQKELDTIIESVRLTATSYGLQLMKLVVVEDPEIREKLVDESYGQRQVAEASHLFVLCRERELTEEHFEQHAQNLSEAREVDPDRLDRAKHAWMRSILSMNKEEQKVWMEKQIYIALGNLLTACAVLGVDTCPMEGFKSDAYDSILELADDNLASVLVIPIGFRSEEDELASANKVRRSTSQFLLKR